MDFESVLIKSLLTNKEFFGKTISLISSHHFQNLGNAETFKLIKDYFSKYHEVPNGTELIASIKNVPNSEIREEIKKSLQVLREVEPAGLEFLLDETVTFIKDAMYLQALELGSEGLMKRDDSLKLKAEAIMDARARIIIDTDLGLEFDDIESMIEYYSTRNVGLKTSSKEINKRLGPGFLPRTLSLVLSPSGVGKSLFLTHLTSDLIREGKNALLVSLEMADKEIMKRVHANALDLPINALGDLSLTPGELSRLDRPTVSKEQIQAKFQEAKMSGTLGKLFIKEYPPGTFSSLQLESLIMDYKIQKGITFDVVFVDYMGIMKSDLLSPSAGLYSYIKSIAEELRSVAVRQDLAVISAQQLNRGSVNNKDADNSNVSDSLGSVMTADFLMFLLQDEEMKAQSEIAFKITKNRFNGRTDTFLMNIDYEKMRFSDMITEGDFNGTQPKSDSITDSFGIVTAQKQKNAEEFGDQAVREIESESWKRINELDQKNNELNSTDDILRELGLS